MKTIYYHLLDIRDSTDAAQSALRRASALAREAAGGKPGPITGLAAVLDSVWRSLDAVMSMPEIRRVLEAVEPGQEITPHQHQELPIP